MSVAIVQHLDRRVGALGDLRVLAHRHPDPGTGQARANESGRSNADDCRRLAVDQNLPAGKVDRALLLPERVTDHRDPRRPRPQLVGREGATPRQPRAEDLEVAVGHPQREGLARTVARIEPDEPAGVGGHLLERLDAGRAEIPVVGIRKGARAAGSARLTALHHHDAMPVVVQRPEQQRIDQAEHPGVDTDAERQGQNADHAEAGIAPEEPHGDARVAPQLVGPAPAPAVARPVLKQRPAAKSGSRGAHGLLLRHPTRHPLGDILLQMEAHLGLHLPLETSPSDERSQARAPGVSPGHGPL